MKLMQYLQKNRLFFVLLFVVLLIHLILMFSFREIWWDSGVYAAMGKYLFSAGSAGLWEHIRPPLLPAVLGFIWILGFDIIVCGMILELLCSLGAIILLYEITKHYFKEKTALFASAIFAFSSIFFYLSFHLYTEVPAIFLVLLAVYLFILKKYYWSGAIIALAFLAKFPAGLFLIPLLIVLIIDKDLKSSAKVLAGFAILLAPVLVAYQIIYSNALLPFIDARHAILNVLGCNVLRFKPWWHYIYLIISENALNLFAIIGIIGFFRRFNKSKLLPLLCLAVPLIYFTQLHCRDARYLVLFIPFVAMFSGLGLTYFMDSFQKQKKQIFTLMLLLVLGFSVFNGAQFFTSQESALNPSAETYYLFLEDKEISKEVWSSNPIVAFFTDARIEKIYYPVYNAEVAADFDNYLKKNAEKIQYVLLDNCGGGIICAEDDKICKEENKKTLILLNNRFEKVLDEKHGRCFYKVYENN